AKTARPFPAASASASRSPAPSCAFFFSSRRRHTRLQGDWSSDVCSSDLTLSPKDARQLFRETRPASTPTPAEIGAVKNLTADGPGGPIPLRVYRPADVPAGTPLPVLVYYHGGGWVIGDLDTHDVQCRQITAEAGITGVAVDYRLAPEHKFPAAVDDAWAATRWVVAHAGELGIDGRRVAVAGDSAGGNLAAVVALMARDAGGPAIALQVLIYPVTDV